MLFRSHIYFLIFAIMNDMKKTKKKKNHFKGTMFDWDRSRIFPEDIPFDLVNWRKIVNKVIHQNL